MRRFLNLLVLLACAFPIYAGLGEMPRVDGWQRSEKVQVFDPETLFDFINGASDLYLTYDFKELQVAEYFKEPGKYVKVEIYQHQDPISAFGIYSQERSPDMNFLTLGAQGYGDEGFLNFVKDHFYVKLSSYEVPFEQIKQLARELSAELPGSDAFPDQVAKLPEENKVPNSEMFIATNFMGHSFMNKAITADYKVDGNNFSIFMMDMKNPAASEQVLLNYYEFIKKPAKKVKQGLHQIKDPYNGDVQILWHQNHLYGSFNSSNKKLSQQYLKRMGQQ